MRGWTSAIVTMALSMGASAAFGDDLSLANGLARANAPAIDVSGAARTTFESGTPPMQDLMAASASPSDRLRDDSPRAKKKKAKAAAADDQPALAEIFTAERARILLRSLTVPGWGQATAGNRTSAAIFGVAELGIWTSFTAFRIQEQLRRGSYERTARILAGIDLKGRDEEFRRIVGSYLSSEQYNQLVVFRDAANLYYDDPAAYRQYISQHEIGGKDSWDWRTENDLLNYRRQRQDMQKAGRRANTAFALAVINRLVSSVHAARAHGANASEPSPRSWNFEVVPSDPDDATAFQLGVRARF